MKINIQKKESSSIDNGLSIQDKVNKIMGIDNTNEPAIKERDKNIMDINKANKSKSILELKKSQGINKDNLDLSIDKFSKVKDIMDKLENLDNTFTEFLKNQNSVIEVINSFTNRLDTFEVIQSNGIKNQKSILDAINSIAAKFKNVGTFFEPGKKENKSESKEVETKLIKGKHKKEDNNLDSIESIFSEFQVHFNNNNFMGSKELTSESKAIFTNLIEAIDDSSLDSIIESIGKFRSQLTKESGRYMTARKSNKNFDSAIVKTIEVIKGNSFDIKESKENSTTIDKNYFSTLFNIDLDTIEALIQESIVYHTEYKKIDSDLIDGLTDYIKGKNPETTDNSIGMFINYIKAYIEAIG